MADCVVREDQLVVRLSAGERLEAVHRDVAVALTAIRSVEVVEDAMTYVHGLRLGTGVPGTISVGTFTSTNAKIFAVIHHSQHRGVRIVLEGADYDEILISSDDAESLAASIPVAS